MKNKLFLTFVAVISIVGLYLRFIQINQIDSLYPDVAINGLEALYSPIQPFYFRFGEHNEGLYIVLLKGFFAVFGSGVWQVYGLSALIGSATVTLFIWIITKLKDKTTGIIAGIILATSPWHIALSRSGFRSILVPFILGLIYLLFQSYWSNKTVLKAAVIGVLLGLGFYTYPAYRAIAIFMPFILMAWWLFSKQRASIRIKHLSIMILAGLITLIPTILMFIAFPEPLASRVSEVSVFTHKTIMEGFILAAKQAGKVITGYFFVGDQNWRVNYGQAPLIQPIVSLGFIAGLGLIAKNISFATRSQKIFNTLVLLNLAIFLIPAVFTFEGGQSMPHNMRLSGQLLTVFGITAVGINYLFSLIKKLNQSITNYANLFLIVALLASLFIYSHSLVRASLIKEEYAKAIRSDLRYVANYLILSDSSHQKIAHVSEFERFTLNYLLKDTENMGIKPGIRAEYLEQKTLYDAIHADYPIVADYNVEYLALNTGDEVVVPVYSDQPDSYVISYLKNKYPALKSYPYYADNRFPNKIAFWIYSL